MSQGGRSPCRPARHTRKGHDELLTLLQGALDLQNDVTEAVITEKPANAARRMSQRASPLASTSLTPSVRIDDPAM